MESITWNGRWRFYRDGLGLPTDGISGREFEHGAVAFFQLQSGLRLAVRPRASIAHDTGLTLTPPSPTEFTFGHNVGTKDEVDAVRTKAKPSGAVLIQEAHDTFYGGDAGSFQDPDGHLWEVVGSPASDIV